MAEEPSSPEVPQTLEQQRAAAFQREANARPERDFIGRVGERINDLRADRPVANIAFSLAQQAVTQRIEDKARNVFQWEDMAGPRTQGINTEAWRPGVSLARGAQDVDIGSLRDTLSYDVGVNVGGFDLPSPAGMVSLRFPLGGSRDERPEEGHSNLVQRARDTLGR